MALRKPYQFAPLVIALFIAPALQAAPASRPAEKVQWTKYEEGKEPSLQTAIATYQNKDGVKVSLVGAIHIADKPYYEDLNKTFAGYDALLYEMVKPKDTAAPRPGAVSDNPIHRMQRFLKDVLGLEFQLDGIDYSAKNFVHADLDAETFAKMQKERGESMFTIILQQLLDSLKNPPRIDPKDADPDKAIAELLGLLTRPDGERQIKALLAKQMQDIEATAAGLSGPKGSVILTERNTAAYKVLGQTLASGKKNIGIFYGAAHMPDLAERLNKDGFKLTGVEYRTAWELTIRPNQPSALEKLVVEIGKLLTDR